MKKIFRLLIEYQSFEYSSYIKRAQHIKKQIVFIKPSSYPNFVSEEKDKNSIYDSLKSMVIDNGWSVASDVNVFHN